MVIDCSVERPFDREHWLSASEAYRLVCTRNGGALAASSITARAGEGIVRTWAERFTFEARTPEGGKAKHSFSNAVLPKEFWWTEGGESLRENWQSGDFSNWIDGQFEWKAFGVLFDRADIQHMLGSPSTDAASSTTAVEEQAGPATGQPVLSDEQLVELIHQRRSWGQQRNQICKELGKLAGPNGNQQVRDLYKDQNFARGRRPKNAQ